MGTIGTSLGSVAVVLSVYGWLTGFTLMMPRVLYSMATHRELPAVVGLVHPRYRTPHIAIVTNALVALAMALYSSFAQAATFAAIARLVVFAVTCAALVMLRRTQGPSPGFQLPGGTMFAVAGTAFSMWLLATRSASQLLIVFGIIAAGIVLRSISRRD